MAPGESRARSRQPAGVCLGQAAEVPLRGCEAGMRPLLPSLLAERTARRHPRRNAIRGAAHALPSPASCVASPAEVTMKSDRSDHHVASARALVTGVSVAILSFLRRCRAHRGTGWDRGVPHHFTAQVKFNGQSAEMATPQSTDNCDACHTSQGVNGAPGRIIIPGG